MDHDPGRDLRETHRGAALVREGHGIELGADTARLIPPGPLYLTGEVSSRAPPLARVVSRGSGLTMTRRVR